MNSSGHLFPLSTYFVLLQASALLLNLHYSPTSHLLLIVPIGTPILEISKYPDNPSRKIPLPKPSLTEIILCHETPTSPVGLSSEIFVPSTNTSSSMGGVGPFLTPHCTFQAMIAEPLSHSPLFSFSFHP